MLLFFYCVYVVDISYTMFLMTDLAQGFVQCPPLLSVAFLSTLLHTSTVHAGDSENTGTKTNQ